MVDIQKPLLPQIIEVSDSITPAMRLGSTLVTAMPNKGGNINGDPGLVPGDATNGTSDLIIASSTMNDPSIQMPFGKATGMGYVLFGHPASLVTDSLQTTPGLFVGPSSFSASLLPKVVNGVTLFHYAPLQLRPYDANTQTGAPPTGQFFMYDTGLGDMNGDKTGDILMTTPDLHRGADTQSTQVVNGGGFTLFY
jgi:hypothetical protein